MEHSYWRMYTSVAYSQCVSIVSEMCPQTILFISLYTYALKYDITCMAGINLSRAIPSHSCVAVDNKRIVNGSYDE